MRTGAKVWVKTAGVVLLLVLALPMACRSNDEQRLVLTGSSTIAPLATELGRRFEAENPGVRVDVQSGGSGRGINDVRSGLADIGMVSRGLNPDEGELHAVTIARDGVCVIVHKDNPVTALDDETVRKIYRGQIEDWGEVGGTPGPITVVNKAEGRSTLELFLKHYGLENAEVKPDVVIGDNEQGVRTVAGNPGAIGYVSIGTAEYDAEVAKVSIKLLPVGGVAATTGHVQDGSFPLARPLNLVTEKAPEGLARRFIEFATSERVHDLVKAQYFVTVAP